MKPNIFIKNTPLKDINGLFDRFSVGSGIHRYVLLLAIVRGFSNNSMLIFCLYEDIYKANIFT